jgi:hypothetical protein
MKSSTFITGCITTLIILAGCQSEYPIEFGESDAVVGINETTLDIKENQTGVFNIYLGGALSIASTDVTLEVSADGLDNPAIEGTDFTMEKAVTAKVGLNSITVSTINNNIFEGNKQFRVQLVSNSKSYPISKQNLITITISDDDHPLQAWIGTYRVAATSYGWPGTGNESWTVQTSPVEGKTDKLSLRGIGISDSDPIIATLDPGKLTITIEPDQNIGSAYEAYGPSYAGDIVIYYGLPDLTLIKNSILSGTLNSNGSIHIDNWGELYIATPPEPDWTWDVFNTTWTKQ